MSEVDKSGAHVSSTPQTPFFEPPASAIDIGGGHRIVYAHYQDEVAGIQDWHRKADGNWCCGWVPFRGTPWSRGFESNPSYQAWDVVQREPLTITPSMLCRACKDHGFITNGQWVKA